MENKPLNNIELPIEKLAEEINELGKMLEELVQVINLRVIKNQPE